MSCLFFSDTTREGERKKEERIERERGGYRQWGKNRIVTQREIEIVIEEERKTR